MSDLNFVAWKFLFDFSLNFILLITIKIKYTAFWWKCFNSKLTKLIFCIFSLTCSFFSVAKMLFDTCLLWKLSTSNFYFNSMQNQFQNNNHNTMHGMYTFIYLLFLICFVPNSWCTIGLFMVVGSLNWWPGGLYLLLPRIFTFNL